MRLPHFRTSRASACLGIGVLGALLASGGCAPAVSPRLGWATPTPGSGHAGGAIVFLPGETDAALAGAQAWEFEEYSRRDAALGVGNQPTPFLSASSEWPGAEMPSLERSRFVSNYASSTGGFVIYVPERRHVWRRSR